jgi:hypothetical protein
MVAEEGLTVRLKRGKEILRKTSRLSPGFVPGFPMSRKGDRPPAEMLHFVFGEASPLRRIGWLGSDHTR